MRDKTDKTTQTPLTDAHTAEGLRNDLDKLKEMAGAGELAERAGYGATSQIDELAIDKESIKKKIAILSRQLDAHKNQKITDPIKRNQIVKRREELERQFKPCLESFRDLGVVRRDSPDWHPAYRKAIERPKYEHLITEWKRLGLMLEPDDRFINDLDHLRD